MSPRERDAGPRGRPGWGRLVSKAVVSAAWSPRAHGVRHVPPHGPVLLASNHLGVVDGPLVHAMSPRPVHFLVKREMFTAVTRPLWVAAGQIPVDRTGDRGALLAAVAVLRRGAVVGVFPEGTRGRGDLAAAHGGVTWLALQTGAPVVPVAVLGTRRTGESTSALPPARRRLDVVFGRPLVMTAPPGVPRRDAQRAAHDTLRAAMDDHVLEAVALTGQDLPEDLGWTSDQIARGEHL